MDESELRHLTEDLRDALPDLISDDAERRTVFAALETALGAPSGSARPALRAALESHAETRKWLRDHLPREAERVIDLGTDPTTVLGTIFICPREDFDFVRETPSQPVPHCPVHRTALVRVEG